VNTLNKNKLLLDTTVSHGADDVRGDYAKMCYSLEDPICSVRVYIHVSPIDLSLDVYGPSTAIKSVKKAYKIKDRCPYISTDFTMEFSHLTTHFHLDTCSLGTAGSNRALDRIKMLIGQWFYSTGYNTSGADAMRNLTKILLAHESKNKRKANTARSHRV
jgi:hypothetical protein